MNWPVFAAIPALGTAAAPGQQPPPWVNIVPLVLIMVVFYFLLIRPQQKKAKEHAQLLGTLRSNDRVVTSGGLIGQVTKVLNDAELQVEIAEGVRVRMARSAVSEVVSKTAPADSKADEEDDAEDDKKGN